MPRLTRSAASVQPRCRRSSSPESASELGLTEAADLGSRGIERAITDRVVTYDFARLMDGATEVGCSGFAEAVVERM